MTGAFSIFFFVYAWFTNKLKKRSRCLDLHKHHQEKKWRMRKRRIGVKRKTYLKIGCIDQCVHWTSVYILTPFPLPPPPTAQILHGGSSRCWRVRHSCLFAYQMCKRFVCIPEESHLLVLLLIVPDDLRGCHAHLHTVDHKLPGSP